MKLPEISMPIPPGRNYCLFRMMVICLLCLFVIGHPVSAQAPAGNITLALKNVTVKHALQELRKKTSYELYYSDSEMGVARQVTVNLRNATVTEALQAILGKAYIWRIQGKYIAITPAPVSDSRQVMPADATAGAMVSGAVITATGTPLAGVSIRIKGTSTGTATNGDGYFEIPARDGVVLQCSFIGYRTAEVAVTGIHTPLRIVLEENPRALEQVVVTGYTAKRVGELTGAVAQVDAEQLQTTTTQSIFDNLQGKVAGLNISASGSNTSSRTQSNIVIRGKGSMSNGTQPLIVIDGIIQDYASDEDPLGNFMIWKANHYDIDPEYHDPVNGSRSIPSPRHNYSLGVNVTL